MTVSPIVLEPIEGDSTEVEEWLVVEVVRALVSSVPATFEQAQHDRDLHKLAEPEREFALIHLSAFQ